MFSRVLWPQWHHSLSLPSHWPANWHFLPIGSGATSQGFICLHWLQAHSWSKLPVASKDQVSCLCLHHQLFSLTCRPSIDSRYLHLAISPHSTVLCIYIQVVFSPWYPVTHHLPTSCLSKLSLVRIPTIQRFLSWRRVKIQWETWISLLTVIKLPL